MRGEQGTHALHINEPGAGCSFPAVPWHSAEGWVLRPRGQSSFLPSREHSGCSATSRGGLREMGGQSQQEISDGGDLMEVPSPPGAGSNSILVSPFFVPGHG